MNWSFEAYKKQMLRFDQKRHFKGEKHIISIDFAEHLIKSDV